jgi:hypothetical protein
MPFRDMMMLHFFIGVGCIVFFAIRALRRDNKPPRWIGDFGSGFIGEEKKWLQWYSWAMLFEFITSIFYIHTGLFYYEIGMSVFEGLALTIGAWAADRLVDFFLGAADISIPGSDINFKKTQDAMSQKVADLNERIQKLKKNPQVDEEVLRKQNKDFDDLTKGL